MDTRMLLQERLVRVVNRNRMEDKEAGRIHLRYHIQDTGKGESVCRKDDEIMYYDKDGRKAETPQDRYIKKNTKMFQFRLNHKTDADIIAKLESVSNRTGYIKGLIRRDLKGEK